MREPDKIFEINLPQLGDGKIKFSNSFDVNLLSGSVQYSIPLQITTARELTPNLAINYSSAAAQNIFGYGFNLSIPSITRSTLRGFPYYEDDKDTFIFKGQELVQIGISDQDFILYKPRLESEFSSIEYHRDINNSYWVVRQKNGINHIFGKEAKNRVHKSDKDIYAWYLEKTYDAKGNIIQYI